MAFATSGFYLSLTAVDYGANIVQKRWKMAAATNADALTAAAAFIPLYEAVSDTEVLSYSVAQGFDEGTVVAPTVINPASVVASITALIAGAGNKKVNISVPSPKIGIFVAATGDNADIVDGADAALVAYMAAFQTGGTLLVSDGEVMGAFQKGIRVTQKRRLSGGN